MSFRASRVLLALLLGGALLCAGAAAGQGSCTLQAGPLARALVAARPPAGLAAAQQTVYAAAVAALRRGDGAGAAHQLVALARTKPSFARGDQRCALIFAAVRQGAVEPDRARLTRLSQLSQAYTRLLDSKRESVKATRDDVESKYKACEQGGQSDYQILISIVKTIEDELGVFNKGLS